MKIAQSFFSEFSLCSHRLQSSLPILLSGIRRPLSMCIFRSLTKFGWVLGHLFRAQSSLWPQMLMPAHVLLLKVLACLIFFLCRFHSSLPNPNFFCKAFIDSGKLPLFQWILFFFVIVLQNLPMSFFDRKNQNLWFQNEVFLLLFKSHLPNTN